MSADTGGSFFVDTNVLLYSICASEPAKQPFAQHWLDSMWKANRGRTSWQVIHEFYSVAVRKLGVQPAVAREVVERLMLWTPELPSHPVIRRAWHWCDSAQIHFWDAQIVAAAERVGSRWLVSEDFQAGRKFGIVTVVNPFASDPKEFGLA